MRSIIFSLVAFAAVVAGAGEKFKWTGAASASWTNAANWQIWDTASSQYKAATRCPGNNLNNCLKDECIFGAIADGNSTDVDITLTKLASEDAAFSVTNIYLIHIVSGAPSYTFKGPVAWKVGSYYNTFHFENGGGITIDSDVVNDQYVTCPIANFPRTSSVSAHVYLKLNAANVTLHVNGHVNDSSQYGNNNVYISGVGDFEWYGTSTGDWGPSWFDVKTFGKVTLKDKQLQPKGWEFGNAQRITIPSGYGSMLSRDGGAFRGSSTIFKTSTIVDGGGNILLNADRGATYGVNANAGATVTLDAVLHPYGADSSYIRNCAWLGGAGTFVLCSSNDFSQALMLSGGVTVKAAKFGPKNCAKTESNIGTGSDILYYGSGTLVYTGIGETCDRDYIITNTANIVAGVLSEGSGALTVTGRILAYGTGATVKMGGTSVSPVKFKGTFDPDSQNVTLQVKGYLDLSEQAAIPAKVTAISFASGKNQLKVPVGVTTTIPNWKTPTTDVIVDFVVPDDTTVVLGGVTTEAMLPNTITINASPAKVAANGTLTVAEPVKWKTAQNGNWNEAAKWDADRVPTALDAVYVDAIGDENYTVTINDDSAAQIKSISIGTGSAACTAIVSVEKNLTLDGSRGIKVVKGGKVTFGGEGADAKELRWQNSAGGTMIQHGGEIEFSGDSKFVISNENANTAVTFGTGSAVFKDRAGVYSDTSLLANIYVTPDAEGETSRLAFCGYSFWTMRGNESRMLIGYNLPAGSVGVLDYEMATEETSINVVKTGYAAGMTSCFIGPATAGKLGNGVLNIKQGKYIFSNLGINVGCGNYPTCDMIAANSGTVSTGIVNQTGGKVNGCSYMPGYSPNSIVGLVVGNGARFYAGNTVYGEYNLKGGYIEDTGLFFVGVGPSAYGVMNIGDADHPNASQYAHFSGHWTMGEIVYRNPAVIGFGKGKGLFNVFGAKATVYFYNGLYIGGTDVKGLRVRSDYTDSGCQSGTREAEGELRISAGKVSAEYNYIYNDVYLGGDGKGMLSMSGNGSFKCNDLVLSNRTESVVKLTLPANGVPGWTLKAMNEICITDGASLVVDASAVTKISRITRLAESQSAVKGEFGDGKYTVLGDNAMAELLRGATILYANPQNAEEKGIYLQRPKLGGFILLR